MFIFVVRMRFVFMADTHDRATRSYNMSRIKSKNTKPELWVRKYLFSQGLRYRINVHSLPGSPDIVLAKYKTVVFINGCFWHGHAGCRYFVIPETRKDWWIEKINKNIERDNRANEALRSAGWNVIIVWECQLKPQQRSKTLADLAAKSGTTYDPFFPQITYLCTEVNVKSISATMNVSDILYKKLKIKTDETCPPTEEMLAVITHWMHNAGKASASPYGEKCRKYLQTILCASDPSFDKKDITLKSIKEQGLFQDAVNVPFPSLERSRFTFIDLFAGMGGFRLAMQKHGGRCVFSSEWNAYAQKTYFANFGEVPFGDITDERIKAYIPDNFDVLCAGFPCQPFSIAGISKKNSLGRAHGFWIKLRVPCF